MNNLREVERSAPSRTLMFLVENDVDLGSLRFCHETYTNYDRR